MCDKMWSYIDMFFTLICQLKFLFPTFLWNLKKLNLSYNVFILVFIVSDHKRCDIKDCVHINQRRRRWPSNTKMLLSSIQKPIIKISELIC